MSSSRRRRRSTLSSPAPGAAAAALAEQQVGATADELVSRLRALLPHEAAGGNGKAKAASSSRVLREACAYIRRLHAELDVAAERLARLLEDDNPSAADAAGGAAGADDD